MADRPKASRWAARAAKRQQAAESVDALAVTGQEADSRPPEVHEESHVVIVSLPDEVGADQADVESSCLASGRQEKNSNPARLLLDGCCDSSRVDDDLAAELDLLHAVFPGDGEVCVAHPADLAARVTVQVVPLTAGDHSRQFVRCELVLDVPKDYPKVAIQCSLGKSRGLLDSQIVTVVQAIEASARELEGHAALYSVVEVARELLTAFNVPDGECGICLGDFPTPSHELSGADADAMVVRTTCFHLFHLACLASYWQTECARKMDGVELSDNFHISQVPVFCPECRSCLAWDEMPQLHSSLEQAFLEMQTSLTSRAPDVECNHGEVLDQPSVLDAKRCSPTVAMSSQAHSQGRLQRRTEAEVEASSEKAFVWFVEIQNSDTAHSATSGSCSVKIVATKGESEELFLNDGGGMKSGEFVKVEARVRTDLGELIYVELKNTSAVTWRPHWLRVHSPDGKESFIFSRQFVAKGRTQKARVEVSGGVGLRALPPRRVAT